MTPHRTAVAVALSATLALAGCTSDGSPAASGPSGKGPSTAASPSATGRAAYADARSNPVEDSVYPDVGDPGVDALHYDLDLSWDPASRRLAGQEELLFRATADADHVRLDLAAAMVPTAVTVGGRAATYQHPGKDLVVDGTFRADHTYTLRVEYAGTPTPVAAPSTRGDTSSLGLRADADGGLWTMQEPYGAFTWYAVNDQPSDKARYDVTVDVPEPMVGISNGTLADRSSEDGRTRTRWHLDEPAAAYLITLAVGRYSEATARSASGVPISYWTTPDDTEQLRSLKEAPALLDWLEKRLGPYPFDSLGFVIVAGRSGMETQTMITLGRDPSDSEPDVLLHEMAHQWYGDLVTPSDWRDLWMSEGMAMYLQGAWQDDAWNLPAGDSVSTWVRPEIAARRSAGPPGAYDPGRFAELNVYYGPAVMWDRLRRLVGDTEFWRLVREWPAARAERSTDRRDYLAWVQQQTGRDLGGFFHRWLMGRRSPSER